eukprot:1102017-Pyramimonas_sp.AAC.1
MLSRLHVVTPGAFCARAPRRDHLFATRLCELHMLLNPERRCETMAPGSRTRAACPSSWESGCACA